MSTASEQERTGANSQRAIRWVLFLTFIHTIPSPWFYFAIAGLAPTFLLLGTGVVGVFWLTGASMAIALYVLFPALLYCLVYTAITHLLAAWIGRSRSPVFQSVLVSLIAASLLVTAFLPIYVSGGHSGTEAGSIVDLWSITRLSRIWLYAYTALLVLALGGLVVVVYRGSPLPRRVIWRLCSSPVGKPVMLLAGVGVMTGFIYLNHVLLICRPLGELGVSRAQMCMGKALRSTEHNKLWGEENAQTWFERAALGGNMEAAWTLFKMASNLSERKRWLKLAATAGNGGAQYELYRLLRRHDRTEEGRQAALRWLRTAAESGETRAQYDLGSAYRRGNDTMKLSKNLAQARQWLEVAADGGHHRAMWEVADHYERGTEDFPLDLEQAKRLYRQYAKSVRKHRTDVRQQRDSLFNADTKIAAIEALQSGVESGSPEAIKSLTLRHLEAYEPGPGVRRRGMKLLEQLANQGDPEAQYDVGAIYVSGRYGIPNDEAKGSEWWRRAAESHHLKAMARVADGYTNGNYGFDIDYLNAQSQIETLIRTYRTGLYGAQIDEAKARHWEQELAYIQRAMQRSGGIYIPKEKLRRRAAANDAQAQYQLARQLAAESMRKHGSEVLNLYTRAAANSHVEAQMALFQLYRRGLTYTSTSDPGKISVVVPQDHGLTLRYLQQAAAGNHPQAMAELALAYEKGRFGLSKDLVKARDLYQEIVHASENHLYGWEVDERFIGMQRRRLEYSNRALERVEKRRQRYDHATDLERRIMDIEDQYAEEYARRVNAVCVDKRRCTREYLLQERDRIRRKLFAERDRKIANLKETATRSQQTNGKIQY